LFVGASLIIIQQSLCARLGKLAMNSRLVGGATEAEKQDAANLVDAIRTILPQPESFETEQVPALLMELRNMRCAPVTFRPTTPSYSSRRELVEKFADEKKVAVPVAPAMVSACLSSASESKGVPAVVAGLMCSFCGTQSSPEWRKGPNGEKKRI
jgi:hypothetical protein